MPIVKKANIERVVAIEKLQLFLSKGYRLVEKKKEEKSDNAVAEEKSEAAANTVERKTGLEDMNMSELRTLASKAKIPNYSSLTKKELIAVLKK